MGTITFIPDTVLTAEQLNAALAEKVDKDKIGVANGVAALGPDSKLLNHQLPTNVATLDSNGKLLNSQLPPLAITETFSVASESSMLALNAQKGDIAVRMDTNKTFILAALPGNVMSNWVELRSPVSSVAGKTGAVTLNVSDLTDGDSVARKTGFRMDGVIQSKAAGTIPAASNINLSTVAGNQVTIQNTSGNTETTSFGAVSELQAGTRIHVVASITGGSWKIKHNATSLIVPGGSDWSLADGDSFDLVKISDSQAHWRIEKPTKADGTALVSSTEFASDAEYIEGTETTKALSPAVVRENNLVRETAKAASGVSVDFTNIEPWVKRITIQFRNVSTNGSAIILVQIGDAGGLEGYGYDATSSALSSGVATTNSINGFPVFSNGAAYVLNGSITLTNVAGNHWVISGAVGNSTIANLQIICSGGKELSGRLDRLRIATGNGIDVFDNGIFNIIKE